MNPFTGKEEFYEGERGLICPSCEGAVNTKLDYCPSCQYRPPSKRKDYKPEEQPTETPREKLFFKYFTVKMSQLIDYNKFLTVLERETNVIVDRKHLTKDGMITGSNLAEAVLESMITEEKMCPVCGHPMGMHLTEESYIWLSEEKRPEDKRIQYQMICEVPKCHITHGKQGLCFSSIPDDIVGEPEENFENKEENGVYSA